MAWCYVFGSGCIHLHADASGIAVCDIWHGMIEAEADLNAAAAEPT